MQFDLGEHRLSKKVLLVGAQGTVIKSPLTFATGAFTMVAPFQTLLITAHRALTPLTVDTIFETLFRCHAITAGVYPARCKRYIAGLREFIDFRRFYVCLGFCVFEKREFPVQVE